MEKLVKPIQLKNLNSSDNPLQTEFWAKVKSINGWVPYGFKLELEPETDVGPTQLDTAFSEQTLLVLVRNVAGRFALAYIPFAPSSDNRVLRSELLSNIAKQIIPYIKENIFAVRFDLPWEHTVIQQDISDSIHSLHHLPYEIQPEYTSVIDLSPPLDTIYNSFKKRAKRNIMKCRNIDLKPVNLPEDILFFNSWYETYCITAERDGFQPRSADYIKNILTLGTAGKSADITSRLMLAFYEDQIIAGIVTLQSKKRAVFLIGSSLRDSNIGCSPSYILQWHCIKEAKEAGCLEYDLFGIPPQGDSTHYLSGLHLFNSAFGGKVLSRPGTWDVQIKKIPYYFFSTIEARRIKKARKVLIPRNT